MKFQPSLACGFCSSTATLRVQPLSFNLPPHTFSLTPHPSPELFNVAFGLFLRYYPDCQSNF